MTAQATPTPLVVTLPTTERDAVTETQGVTLTVPLTVTVEAATPGPDGAAEP